MLALSLILLMLALGTIFVIFLTSREHGKNTESQIRDSYTPIELMQLQQNIKNMGAAADRTTMSWEDFQKVINDMIEAKE